MSTTNAIMQRIEQMGERWEQFAAHPAARLACWRLDHDSSRMFDLFLELQQEEASEIPDLFIRCAEPLVDAGGYGLVVRESLIQQYDEVREAMRAEGIAADWKCPPPRRNADDVETLIAACDSLQKTHAALVRHVVLVLLPHHVSSADVWREWLRRLLAVVIPEHVRFLVVDEMASPRLTDLCPGEPERAMPLQLDLRMPAAYLELLREVPGGGPALVFRRFFVALGSAVGAGNIDLAKRLASHATRIAGQQQWPHLQTAVAMMLGSALLAKQDHAGAVDSYRQGAKFVAGATDELSRKVAVQAQFAEASALLAASRPAEAAQVYEAIQAAGQTLNDPFARLEGARMAAYCHELAGDQDAAWKRNLDALAAAEAAGSSSARQSTMPFAGSALGRLAQGRPAAESQSVRQRLDQLLGTRWENALAGEAQP
jgi:hypothetical protein